LPAGRVAITIIFLLVFFLGLVRAGRVIQEGSIPQPPPELLLPGEGEGARCAAAEAPGTRADLQQGALPARQLPLFGV